MVDWQTDPGELYVPTDAPDGVYLARKDGVRFTEFLLLVDGANTTVVVDPVTGDVQIDATTAPSTAYREVLMESGVTPPAPLSSSDGYDWLYGEAP